MVLTPSTCISTEKTRAGYVLFAICGLVRFEKILRARYWYVHVTAFLFLSFFFGFQLKEKRTSTTRPQPESTAGYLNLPQAYKGSLLPPHTPKSKNSRFASSIERFFIASPADVHDGFSESDVGPTSRCRLFCSTQPDSALVRWILDVDVQCEKRELQFR